MRKRIHENNICLALALNDTSGELLAKAKKYWGPLESRFSQIVVHITTSTHSDWFQFLADQNIPTASAEQNWDDIGLHRRRSLSLALVHSDAQWFLYTDPDHILRWLERDEADLDRLLERIPGQDCLVIGRTTKGFNQTPNRLKETESIVNKIYGLITGHEWDLMMAARGLSRRAVELIEEKSKVDTLGNDVAWPLLIESAGLNIEYAEAKGLTYETNRVYAQNATDTLDKDAASWMLRVYAANQHIEAMRPFLGKSIRRTSTQLP